MSGSLNYVKGDATQPVGPEGPKFIIHCCNDIGVWGAGFVLAISRRWPEPEEAYYAWEKEKNGLRLGHTQIVKVEENLWVVNMIGQRGVGWDPNHVWPHKRTPPIRYKAIRHALREVEFETRQPRHQGLYKRVTVHCPRFGAGLAGGDWNVIEQLIREELVERGVHVTVYDFDG